MFIIEYLDTASLRETKGLLAEAMHNRKGYYLFMKLENNWLQGR